MSSHRLANPPARSSRTPARDMRRLLWVLAGATLLAALAVCLPTDALAQAAQAAPGPPREMRQFWHVFIAYAVAWILVFVWILSILRRLRRVDERLSKLEKD